MRRFFNMLLGGLAMIAVALLSAFVTMRLVIHGREVEVPSVVGMTVAEADSLASGLGLNVNRESQFYSTVTPAGRVLSQSPAAGTKVRREWVLRITESIGPQQVSVPNVVGQTEREASVAIRRLSLNLGTVAYIPAPGASGIVLSQTPTPDAAGADGPRISLLVSEPLPVVRTRMAAADAAPADFSDAASGDPNADEYATRIAEAVRQTAPGSFGTATLPTAASPPGGAANAIPGASVAGQSAAGASIGSALRATSPSIGIASAEAAAPATGRAANPVAGPATAQVLAPAYVMPSLIGLSLSAASARVAHMGLRITSMESVANRIRPVAPIGSITAPGRTSNGQPAPIRPIAPVGPITLSDTVVAQSPGAGQRVTKNDAIRITLTH